MKYLILFFPSLLSAATVHLTDPDGGMIPDGSISGLARTLVLDRPGEKIVSIEVDLQIREVRESFPFLGDLYIYLSDGTDLVTLANRAGRDLGSPDGYADTVGVNVSFSDAAATDFHSYRNAGTGSDSAPLTTILTGSFQPDGRLESPMTVVTGDLRVSQLSDFSGQSAQRTFTLFAADLSTGAEHRIDEWTLNIETVAVPEPTSISLVIIGSFFFLTARRRG